MEIKLNVPILAWTAFLLLYLCASPVQAQRRRPVTTSAGTQTVRSPAMDVDQIEQRNQALLQQIMSLQKERDFYKKKITDWTELQKNKAPEQPKPEKEETKPEGAIQPGALAAYYLPITPGILDTLIQYRDLYRRSRKPEPVVLDKDSLFQTAQRLAVMGRYHAAREGYEQLIRSPQAKDTHFLEYGKFLYKIADYQRALEMLSGVTGGNRELAEASYYKGRIYQLTHAPTVAQIDFYRSRYLQPEFPGVETARGFQFFLEGELDSARTVFTRLLQKQSVLSGEIYYGLARVYEAQNEREKAVTCYQRSLVHDPLFVNSYVALAKILYELEDYQSCILFFQKAAEAAIDQQMRYYYTGRSYYFLKQWDKALAEFQKIDDSAEGLHIKKEWLAKIYYIRCLMARETGDHRQALDYFRKAREINPDAYSWMTAALEDLGRIHTKDLDYNDALSYYSRLVRLNPADMETLLKVGQFYYYLGEIDEARRYFTLALNDTETADRAGYWLRQINAIP
ncbi:MAG: tetratricopeptide repeat protein [Fidelibacterota bacterium]